MLFDRYEKPTNTGRYINYYSRHPSSHKRSIVYGLIDRTILLSHPTFHKKNLRAVIVTLLNNCFPLPYIFETINRRIRTLANTIDLDIKKNDQRLQLNQMNFFTIPYVKFISESFLPFIKKFGYNISFSVPNTLNKFKKR